MPEGASMSARGRIYADPSHKKPMLDVVCNLWHPETNPDGYVSLGVAENTLMHKEVAEYMVKTFSVDSHSLTYGDGFSGSHRLRDLVASFVNEHFNPVQPVQKSHVSITTGLGPAIEACAFSLCDPGDGILLARPYYGSFPSDVTSRAEAQIVPVSFGGIDPFGVKALEAYEQALARSRDNGTPIRALLLCNPHNPLGRCYPRDALVAYLRFCQKHQIHLISDEIYALSVWDNPDAPDAPGFTSVLSIETEGLIDPNLVHVLWGMSKDFCSNGIRLGCVITQNKALSRALEGNSYMTCPSALSDRAACNILSDASFVKSFTETNRVRLAQSYRATVQFLEEHHIPYQGGSNAGFFVWVDLFAPLRSHFGPNLSEHELWKLEKELQAALLENKIFLASGAVFGSDVPGWFRIVFGHERAYLEEGLRRIVQVIESRRAP